MLDCASIDPCSLDEDDCDALADCAHTGPGTHECECTSETFGTGQLCSQCSLTCDIGQVLIAPCTSTADIACEAVIASEVLPDIAGAALTYSNEQSYPTTATYTCGHNEMSRTLQPDGTWSEAGALSCVLWVLDTAGFEPCTTTCATAGGTCVDGDWGVNSEATMNAAMTAAGAQPPGTTSQSEAARCISYHGGTESERPMINLQNQCYYITGVSTCSATPTDNGNPYYRLCKCLP
jgi:hypothetical protein